MARSHEGILYIAADVRSLNELPGTKEEWSDECTVGWENIDEVLSEEVARVLLGGSFQPISPNLHERMLTLARNDRNDRWERVGESLLKDWARVIHRVNIVFETEWPANFTRLNV